MKLRWLVLLMLLLFIMEGTIMPWLIPSGWAGRLLPQFTFVFVLYAALYGNRHLALMLGIAFGFLQDIVYYGEIMGVHAFAMGLCGYLVGLLPGARKMPMLAALSVIGLACLLTDGIVYYINAIFRLTTGSYGWALMQHMLPSLFLQLAFALAVYIPARRWFVLAVQAGNGKED